jgi:putative heme iron utilization protein
MSENQAAELREYTRAAKQLCAQQRYAALSTISRAYQGFPFGSIVPYDVAQDGSVVIFVATISQHFQNLKADPRASLLICEPFADQDPQSQARLTLLTRFQTVPEAERDQVAERYFARFPDSNAQQLQHSFVFLRGVPERLRWIGGFGEISWLDASAFAQAALDPLAYQGAAIMAHMNSDHQAALQLYLQAFCGQPKNLIPANWNSVRMRAICSHGFEIQAQTPQGSYVVSIRFPAKLEASSQARQATIELLQLARQQLADHNPPAQGL